MRRRSFLFGAMAAAWGAESTLGTIAYIQDDGIWLRELPDGKPRRLVGGTKMDSPRFSGSGRWITYFRGDALHVVSLDGSLDHALGEPDRGSAVPGSQWFPDRDELLVDTQEGLHLFTPADGWRNARRKIEGTSLPVVFSPDATEMVYADDVEVGRGPGGEPMRTGRLCRLELGRPGSTPKVLVSKYLVGQIPYCWTNNGKYVLSWEDPDFSASAVADGLELFRIPAQGGAPTSLGVTTLVYEDMLSSLPAQNRLAVAAGDGRETWQGKRIAVIDLESATISYLTGNSLSAVCPAWSPDGTAVAFSAAPEPTAGASVGGGEEARELLAKRRIWVADAKGSHPATSLTSDSRYRDETPVWSSDGRYILFCRIDRSDQKSLWLMRAGGTDLVQVSGPLYIEPGLLGVDASWFGYYGHIDWRRTFDWFRG